MSETVQFSLIGREDIRIGRNTFPVTLADGTVVILNELNLDHFDGLFILSDAVTSDITRCFLIRHATSGTAAAGFGTSLVLQGEDSAGTVSDIVAFVGQFDDATAGSEDSTAYIYTRRAGAALSKAFALRNTGNFIATLQAALTADRTITIPDATDQIVMRDTTDTLTNKTLTNPRVKAGTGGEDCHPIGAIDISVGTVGTDANTNEKVLKSYTLPANTLAYTSGTNLSFLEVEAWGTTAANANTKTIRLRFGSGTTLLGTVVAVNNITTAPNGASWHIKARIYATGAATQVSVAHVNVGSSNNDIVTASPTGTIASAILVECTGQNGTSAANDIVCTGMIVKYGKA